MAADGLSPKQLRALQCILEGDTKAEAAAKVGCGVRSLSRWTTSPAWQAAMAEARRRAFGEAVSQLQVGAKHAVRTLLRLARDEDTPPAAAVAACRCILELANKGAETLDILPRLEALEAQHGTKRQGV